MNHDVRWLEIDKQAFFDNIARVRSLVGEQKIGFVIKSNAYGHGMKEMVQLANQSNAISYLFTASTHEALEVARIGTNKQVCVLSYLDQNTKACIERGIELVVYDYASLDLVAEAAEQCGVAARVHLKIDTGLSRLGVVLHDVRTIVHAITQSAYAALTGVFTQLADTSGTDIMSTQEQVQQFDAAVEKIRQICTQSFVTHVYASSGIVLPRSYDMVRVGANIYGLVKSPTQRHRIEQAMPGNIVQQILTWKARIMQVKHIPAGAYVGYNRRVQVDRDTVIAVLPVGYADGYPRFLPGVDVRVIVRDQPAPVLGVVSMNMMVIDVTDLDCVVVGDVAILMGNNVYNCIDCLAQKYGTISLELLTKIEASMKRYIV